MLKHFVEYLFLVPGTTSHVTDIVNIEERNVEKLKISDGCTGFRFFDIEVDNGKCSTDAINISGWYYCNCEKITFEDAKVIFKEKPEYKALNEYMEAKGLEFLVKTKTRHYIPLRNIDSVI